MGITAPLNGYTPRLSTERAGKMPILQILTRMSLTIYLSATAEVLASHQPEHWRSSN